MKRLISSILITMLMVGLITSCMNSNEWLYFWDPTESDEANTYKIHPDNSDRALFVHGGQDLQIVGEWVYYLNFTDARRIYRTKLDGTENTAITEQNDLQINAQFYVLNNWIYYSSYKQFLSDPGADEKYYSDTGAQFFRIKTDGTSNETICENKTSYFTIDQDWIYFTTEYQDDYKLYKMKFDGSDLTRIGDVTCIYMKVSAGWIYYVETSMQKLYKIRIDGTDKTELVEDRVYDSLFDHFYLSNGWIYYSDSSGLFKIKTDGTGKTRLTDESGSHLFVDDDLLYYVHSDTGWWGKTYTYRMFVDGTGKKRLYEGFRVYFNPILDFGNTQTGPTENSVSLTTDPLATLHLKAERSLQNAIACGVYHSIALGKDGTAVAAGNGMPKDFYIPMCEVGSWSNLIAVSAGMLHSAGLKSDGTVDAVGQNKCEQCSGTSNWTRIVAIAAGPENTVGLRQDGTVVFAGILDPAKLNEVAKWSDIVAISSGGCIVGLKSDGTVVAVGDNFFGECSVGSWKGIVAVSAGYRHTVGLRSDGTVVATGSNQAGACDTAHWCDIVAVAAGGDFTVGLKKDRTVMVAGVNYDVSLWKEIIAIAAGKFHAIGLKSDGTVVATGNNGEKQCEVSGWTNIGLP